MTQKRVIVLQTPIRNQAALPQFVEDCLRDGVELIAVYGPDTMEVHDIVDDLIIGDGSDESRFILTSWHTGESLDDVIEFAKTVSSDVEVVAL